MCSSASISGRRGRTQNLSWQAVVLCAVHKAGYGRGQGFSQILSSSTDVQEVLGRYALPVLADYLATAGQAAQAQGSLAIRGSPGADCSLGNAAADPLRSAACALYGVCSPSQVRPLDMLTCLHLQ